ncbi:MAG: hypothetical protein JWM57_2217 [Phycisphaerales bacterium]|nr:hypothetical protein [Phycisphaerales bacterium]
MNKVLFLVLFIGAFQSMVRFGVGKTFAYWLLPAVMLFNFAKSLPMPGLPNITANNMVLYGVFCGLPFCWQELRKIRWNILDSASLLVLIPVAITTTMSTGDLKLGQRETMETACRWIFPYFMARIAIQDADSRRSILRSVCVMTAVLGLLTAIECKLKPNMTARFFEKLQWSTVANDGVLTRWGLARAMVTAGQPIDLGCLGVLAGTIILIMLPATGTSWKKPLPLAGILGCGAMVFGSVSNTAWGAMVIAFLGFYLLTRPNLGKLLALPVLLLMLGTMLYLSNGMLNEPYNQERPEGALASSRWIRVKIMQDAWPQASTAGWFGWGAALDTTAIGIGSVDNSYLLFVLQTGWFSLTVWVLMLLIMAIKGSVALARAGPISERAPVAAALSGLLAIVFAMYTVFFGFTYAVMFHIILGMLSTMTQMLARPRMAGVTMQGGMPPHGYAMMQSGMPGSMAGGYR